MISLSVYQLFEWSGDIDVETPYLDARIFNARAESASYVDDTLSSVRRSVTCTVSLTYCYPPQALESQLCDTEAAVIK